jgi:hypothetical protein
MSAGTGRWTRLRRPELAIVAVLGGSLLIGLVILVGVFISNEANRDWYVVASVNGQTIDRATLRDQVRFEEFLYQQQVAEIKAAGTVGHLSPTQASDDQAALAQSRGDPVETARNDLVDQVLVSQLAGHASVTAPLVDPWSSLASYLAGATRRDVRWIDLAPVSPGSAAPDPNEIARVKAALAAGTAPAAVASSWSAPDWQVVGTERWIGASGPLDGVDDQLLTAARAASVGTTIGPLATRQGDTLIAYVATIVADDPGAPAVLAASASDAKVSAATVEAWAESQALDAALGQHLLNQWFALPSRQVRGQEFVVGPAAVSGSAGPWVDLVALDPSMLEPADLPASLPSPASTPAPIPPTSDPKVSGSSSGGPTLTPQDPTLESGRGAEIATWLRSRPSSGRLADILRLAAAANAHATTSTNRSGELGYLTASQLAPGVGAEAFAAGRSTGDVIGPLDVGGRSLILYVEGRYGADLDDRSAGALTELQAPGADDAQLSATFAPDRAALAIDSGWWSVLEFAANDPTGLALFGTATDSLSDPLALDGDLSLFRPLENRTALPDPAIGARLTVEGYANWFGAQRAAATIILAANPLPEAYPSASPNGSAAPTVPPLPTPVIPQLPGSSQIPPSPNPFAPPTLPGGALLLPSFGR